MDSVLPHWRQTHRNTIHGAHDEFGANGDSEMHQFEGVPLRRVTNAVVDLHDDSEVSLRSALPALGIARDIDAQPHVPDAGAHKDMIAFILNT